jgi:hypothetical protein
MPEEPPAPPTKSLKIGKGGGVSEGSEQSQSEASADSSSSEDSESESERASQLSYLQKQVRTPFLSGILSTYCSSLCVCVCVHAHHR